MKEEKVRGRPRKHSCHNRATCAVDPSRAFVLSPDQCLVTFSVAGFQSPRYTRHLCLLKSRISSSAQIFALIAATSCPQLEFILNQMLVSERHSCRIFSSLFDMIISSQVASLASLVMVQRFNRSFMRTGVPCVPDHPLEG